MKTWREYHNNRKVFNKVCVICKNEFTTIRIDQRYCSRKCVHNDLEVIDRMKKNQLITYNKKYGCDHPMKVKVLNKIVVDKDKRLIDDIYCDNRCDLEWINKLGESFFNFLKLIVPNNIEIIRDSRDILYGKKLDYYIPFKKIAFELGGLYWNGEKSGNRGKYYNINKTKSCLYKGIKLIHIFESEWLYQRDIVQDIINNLLGIRSGEKCIYAKDDCYVQVINTNIKNEYLKKHHIFGPDISIIKLGLYYRNELIGVLTINKGGIISRIGIGNDSRYDIIDGEIKLLDYYIEHYNPKSITGYVDRRYFLNDKLYNDLGFNFIRNDGPEYYYISTDYKYIMNHNKYRKCYLNKILKEKYNSTISEWDNMKNNGYDRIWNCGRSVWNIKNN